MHSITLLSRRLRYSLVLFAIWLSGCVAIGPTPRLPTRGDLLSFTAEIDTAADEEVVIKLGVHNGGNPVPKDEAFEGRWQLVGPDDQLRAAGRMFELPALPSGEKSLLRWKGVLDIGGYVLTWGAPNYGATVLQFSVEEREGALSIGDRRIHDMTTYPMPESSSQ